MVEVDVTPAETAGAAKYLQSCARIGVQPESLLLRSLQNPLANETGGKYSTALAQSPFDEDCVRAITTSVGSFRGLHSLSLVGLRRGRVSLFLDESFASLVRGLKSNGSIEKLDLSDCALVDELVADKLALLLTHNVSLIVLTLRHNELEHATGQAVLSALSSNTVLRDFDIACNPLAHWPHLGSAVESMLRGNKSLMSLGLSIGPRPVLHVGHMKPRSTPTYTSRSSDGQASPRRRKAVSHSALQSETPAQTKESSPRAPLGPSPLKLIQLLVAAPRRLRCLRLVHQKLEPASHSLLAALLSAPKAMLAELDLTHSYIGDGGVSKLATALRVNRTLHTLLLPHNGATAAGVNAIAIALHANATLTRLSLASNYIDDESAVSLARALASNPVLTELDVGRSGVGPSGCMALRQALCVSPWVLRLGDLASLPIGVGLRCSMEWFLRRNTEALAEAGTEQLGVARNREAQLQLLPADERGLRTEATGGSPRPENTLVEQMPSVRLAGRRIFQLEDKVAKVSAESQEHVRGKHQGERLLDVVVTRNAELLDTVADLQQQVEALTAAQKVKSRSRPDGRKGRSAAAISKNVSQQVPQACPAPMGDAGDEFLRAVLSPARTAI